MAGRRQRRRAISRLWTGVILLAGLGAGPVPHTSAAERAVLILDASGSMWGQLEGRAKIEIAREVVRDLMGRWSPEATAARATAPTSSS